MVVLIASTILAPTVSSQDDVEAAIDRGVGWLLRAQEIDGSWRGPDYRNYPAGMTALAVYTLRKCGLASDHPAIRKGLAFMAARPWGTVYEAGVRLMALHAVGGKTDMREVRRLVRFLRQTRVGDRWAYPVQPSRTPDLSNTQYALLGLKAAAEMGVKIPSDLWREVGDGLLDSQNRYGGFTYRKTNKVESASMTVAGMGCMLMVVQRLDGVRASRGIRRRLKGAMDLADRWMAEHWSIEKDLLVGDDKRQDEPRWFYYYLYGLERVGAFWDRQEIGGHNWYREGARHLVKKQGRKGAWGTIYGENDMNTCFALLFLRRGSRSTGLSPRARARAEKDEKAGLSIAMNGANPLVAWVRGLGDGVKKRLAAGETATELDWRIDGANVATYPFTHAGDKKLIFEHAFTKNGRHEIRAHLLFVGADGRKTGSERSNPLILTIDDIETEADREAIADLGRNLLLRRDPVASASSDWDRASPPDRAIDGTYCTSWWSGKGDKKPWIQVRLANPAYATTLKFASGQSYAGDPTNWDRPRKVEITINGDTTIKKTLPDTTRRKHVVRFHRRRIHRIRIKILDRYPGKRKPGSVGIKEIELFK